MRNTRVHINVAFCGALLITLGQLNSAEAGFPGIPGLSRNRVKDTAIKEVPIHLMKPAARQKVARVLKSPSLFRRLPVQSVQSDDEMYRYLLRYPEVVVNMWELLGATKVQIRRTGATTFDANDGMGTTCRVELVHESPNMHVMFAEGFYAGALFKNPIKGRCVLVITSGFSKQGEAEYVTNRLDIFMQVDHAGAELIAKTLQPLVGRAAEYNFSESTRFLGQVSQASAKNGAGVQRLAARLQKVDPPIREQFSQLAGQIHAEALRASLARMRGADMPGPPPRALAPVSLGPASTINKRQIVASDAGEELLTKLSADQPDSQNQQAAKGQQADGASAAGGDAVSVPGSRRPPVFRR